MYFAMLELKLELFQDPIPCVFSWTSLFWDKVVVPVHMYMVNKLNLKT